MARAAALRRQRAAEVAFERADSAWRDEAGQLQQELEIASNPAKLTANPDVAIPIILRKGEVALLVASGATLVEPKRLPGQWVGSYSGMSFRIMKGVRYNVGGTRGHMSKALKCPWPLPSAPRPSQISALCSSPIHRLASGRSPNS